MAAFIQVAIFALMLGNGLNIPIDDLRSVWRRPAQLARSLLAVVVLVPLAVIPLLALADLPASVGAGLALLAATPGAPLTATRSKVVRGSVSYAAGLQLTVVALAVVTTPLVLALFQSLFQLGSGLRVSPLAVAMQVALVSLLPVGLGVLVQRLLPRVTEKVGKPVRILADVLLVGVILLIAVPAVRLTAQLGVASLLSVAAMAAAALLLGHAMGWRADLRERGSIATAAIARNLGLAIFIAAANGSLRDVVATIMAYALLGVLVALPYAIWIRRRLARTPPPTRGAAGAAA